MPGKNAAQRISELVERGVRLDGNTAMVNGLNQLFDYSPEDPYRQHAYRLEQVHKQLDLVQVGLTRLGIPDELYAGQLAALRNGFSSSNLSQPYQNLRGQFTVEVRLLLLWAAFVLEDEGGLADQTALGELVKSILGVIADVQASSLPPTLREFLVSHLTDLLVGLQTSPFAGARDLQKAVKSLAADVVAKGEALAGVVGDLSGEDQQLMERAGGAFQQVADMASASGKGSEGIATLWRIATINSPRLGWDGQEFGRLGSRADAPGKE